MKKIKKYLKIWWIMSRNSFLGALNHRIGAISFVVGKVVRFAFFFLFLVSLMAGSKMLSGYNQNQVLFFYLTFNLIDIISQFLFREVYRFRPLIITGNFDLILVKPVSALFRFLLGGADVLDLITIPPLLIAVIVIGANFNPGIVEILLFILLLVNGLLIATAFHIFALSMAIISTEIDHSIMIYREITSLGRFPIDIFKEPLKGVITYIIPVGIMFTFPARALMGIVSVSGVIISLFIGFVLIILAITVWNKVLTRYSSASS